MCGISGAIALDGTLAPHLREGVRAMNGALAHRGPDGDGFHDARAAALGHRRLAIIDVARGAQPMSNEDGTVWIVFNGEIYNHRALRPVLESHGHRFVTSCDTETIVHAYEQYGHACVEHLEGMFAFAIFDHRSGDLFIARDRLGKKPIYYAVLDGALHFASELGALRHSPAWRGDIDLTALEGYLSLGYFLAPSTAFKGVSKLEPGHWLSVANGTVTTRGYWDVTEFDTDRRGQPELVEGIDSLLRTAVHDRLESEVPLGAFLSGGIDSGLIVSYMSEALGDRLVTTSVGFAEAAHNELHAAELTARHVHARHYADVIAPRLEEVFDDVVEHVGEPLADSSAIPTWYVSRSARAHVTVALSGDGGDETFAGYDFRYVPHMMESRVRPFLGGPGRRMARWAGSWWPRSPRLPKAFRLHTIFDNLGRDSAGAYFHDLCFLKPSAARALLGGATADEHDTETFERVTAPYRRCPSPSALQRAQYADLKIYLPNDPLVKVDRMSMVHSLEVRCPLLDRRVVEAAFRIPSAMKQQGRTGKALLRDLAARRLPPALAGLPKRGFTVPIGEWIAGPYRGAFTGDVLSRDANVRSLLDVSAVRRILNRFEPGMASDAYALWAVWVLERWLRNVRANTPVVPDERPAPEVAPR